VFSGVTGLSNSSKRNKWKKKFSGIEIISNGLSRLVVSHISPQDENRSIVHNAVFLRESDDGKSKKLSNPQCYTPPSEPIRPVVPKVGGGII
jgi:hypothetical protein